MELSRSLCETVLAVSQSVGQAVDAQAPVPEFERLRRLLGCRLVGCDTRARKGGILDRVERVTALDISQALHILRRYPDAPVYVSFSERVGIPLGAMLARRKRRGAHVLIAHRLNTRVKRALGQLTGWQLGVDRIITLCAAQLPFGQSLVGDAAKSVKAGVTDDEFYRPMGSPEEDYVLAVGSENRDYDSLIEAAAEADVRVRILSSSPWSRSRKRKMRALPPQVTFLPRVRYSELRALYDRARLVALPVRKVDYAAGLNALLEGYCMNKAVVVSDSPGIAEYVRHMETACVVPASNAAELALALRRLLADSDLRGSLEAGAREEVADYARITTFVHILECEVRQSIGLAGPEARR